MGSATGLHAFLAVVLLLPACGQQSEPAPNESPQAVVVQVDPLTTEVRQAKALVEEQLKDPESVRYRDVARAVDRRSSVPRVVFCGEFNAKNASGGYSGFSKFAVVLPSPTGTDGAEVLLAEVHDMDFPGQAAGDAANASMKCLMADDWGPVEF